MTVMRSAEAPDVVSIGEGQLRFTPPAGVALVQAQETRLEVAGTEGNVLGLLARLGVRTGMVTSLPRTPLGRRVSEEYAQAGVDLSRCVWRDDGRVALYFVDSGSAPVPSRVFYDRADSCFSNLTTSDVDWDYVGSARMVHLSGITAALTDGLYDVLAHAVELARESEQLLSIDVNFRSLLWTPQAARERLEPLMATADVVFCSRRDAATVFGIEGPTVEVAASLAARFAAGTVIVSDGAAPVAVHHHGATSVASPPRTTVVDRVGAGDALIGAFLYGVLHDDVELGLRLGTAAAALALSRHGDQLHTSLDELTWLSSVMASGTDIIR